MSVPNAGPELPYPNDPDETQRVGNTAHLYRDDARTDDVEAASARASTVTHRFGGIRYALSRPKTDPATPPVESGESDESE